MKCPKCGYLGFEKAERCRNCGYDFALAAAPDPPELPLRIAGRTPQVTGDLDLMQTAVAPGPPAVEPTVRRSADVVRSSPNGADELPLFGPMSDDEPLIIQAPTPRPPLAVRRATPEVPKVRTEMTRTPSLVFPEDERPAPVERTIVTPRPPRPAIPPPAAAAPAGLVARSIASVIDLGLLGLVDLAVIYFTVKICGLSSDELSLLPIGPLVAFLVVQNGSYLVAFTAGGQTIGKIVAGIRVVPADAGTTIDLGRALIRTGVWMLLVLPAGLGLLTALMSTERRGLHDRCAGTKVVRATAA